MKGLDLRKFKKTSSTKDHTMLKHPDGHEIKVLHHRLSPSIKDQLEKLPNYDGGGSVKPVTPPPPPPNGTPESAQESMRKAFHFSEGGTQPDSTPQETPAPPSNSYTPTQSMQALADISPTPAPKMTPDEKAHADLAESVKNLSQKWINASTSTPSIDTGSLSSPQATPSNGLSVMVPPTAPTTSQPAPQTAPQAAPTGSLLSQSQADLSNQNQAEMSAAKNTQSSMQAQSDIYGDQAKQMEAMRAKHEQIADSIRERFDNLSHSVEQGHIDPNHWWNSKSTGGQVMTAIGMLLGGAGLGASGHPELASKAIDTAIDRDIDSQKTDLNNKQSLLGKYMEMYKSLPEAENAARLTMHAGVEGLINQQAAKLGSQNAVLAAQAATAARRREALPTYEGLVRGQLQMDALKNMDHMGGTPGEQVRKYGMSGMMSAKQQEDATKELGSGQRVDKLQEDVEQAARELKGQIGAGAFTPSARQSSINTFAGILAKEAEGRFNLEEAKNQMKALMPSPLDTPATDRLKAKHRQQFFESLKVTPVLDSYHIKTNSQPKVTPEAIQAELKRRGLAK